MASESYHEPYEDLPPPVRDLHRAIVSLMEELDAIDWYGQRAEVCGDGDLRAVLLHNREEEIEHAMMLLEWLRRNSSEVDSNVRRYLLTEGPITAAETHEKSSGPAQGGGGSAGLGVGSLKGK